MDVDLDRPEDDSMTVDNSPQPSRHATPVADPDGDAMMEEGAEEEHYEEDAMEAEEIYEIEADGEIELHTAEERDYMDAEESPPIKEIRESPFETHVDQGLAELDEGVAPFVPVSDVEVQEEKGDQGGDRSFVHVDADHGEDASHGVVAGPSTVEAVATPSASLPVPAEDTEQEPTEQHYEAVEGEDNGEYIGEEQDYYEEEYEGAEGEQGEEYEEGIEEEYIEGEEIDDTGEEEHVVQQQEDTTEVEQPGAGIADVSAGGPVKAEEQEGHTGSSEETDRQADQRKELAASGLPEEVQETSDVPSATAVGLTTEGQQVDQNHHSTEEVPAESTEQVIEFYIDEEMDDYPTDIHSLPPILLYLPGLGARTLFNALPDGAKLPVWLSGKLEELGEASLSDVWAAVKVEMEKENLLQTGEMIITEKQMELKMGEDDINLQSITLLELAQVHYGCGLPSPVQLYITFEPHRFITRFNAIQQEVQVQLRQESEEAEGMRIEEEAEGQEVGEKDENHEIEESKVNETEGEAQEEVQDSYDEAETEHQEYPREEQARANFAEHGSRRERPAPIESTHPNADWAQSRLIAPMHITGSTNIAPRRSAEPEPAESEGANDAVPTPPVAEDVIVTVSANATPSAPDEVEETGERNVDEDDVESTQGGKDKRFDDDQDTIHSTTTGMVESIVGGSALPSSLDVAMDEIELKKKAQDGLDATQEPTDPLVVEIRGQEETPEDSMPYSSIPSRPLDKPSEQIPARGLPVVAEDDIPRQEQLTESKVGEGIDLHYENPIQDPLATVAPSFDERANDIPPEQTLSLDAEDDNFAHEEIDGARYEMNERSGEDLETYNEGDKDQIQSAEGHLDDESDRAATGARSDDAIDHDALQAYAETASPPDTLDGQPELISASTGSTLQPSYDGETLSPIAIEPAGEDEIADSYRDDNTLSEVTTGKRPRDVAEGEEGSDNEGDLTHSDKEARYNRLTSMKRSKTEE